jgi:hypothetical protein
VRCRLIDFIFAALCQCVSYACARYCNALASIPIIYADLDFCSFFGIIRGEADTPELLLKAFTKTADKCAALPRPLLPLQWLKAILQDGLDAEAWAVEHVVEAALVRHELRILVLL